MIPTDIKCYVEPFVGGGSVFIELLNRGFECPMIINDINPHLINAYKCIQKDAQALVDRLFPDSNDMTTLKPLFYEVRDRFNAKSYYNEFDEAADFIFLMRTCYRGLYAEKKNGDFETAFGYKPFRIDRDNVVSLGQAFQRVSITFTSLSFSDVVIPDGAFAYLDPPYWEISARWRGRMCSAQPFPYDAFEQWLHQLKCPFVLSNSTSYSQRFHELFPNAEIQKLDQIDKTISKGRKVRKEMLARFTYECIPAVFELQR